MATIILNNFIDRIGVEVNITDGALSVTNDGSGDVDYVYFYNDETRENVGVKIKNGALVITTGS